MYPVQESQWDLPAYRIIAAQDHWLQDPSLIFEQLVGSGTGFLLESSEGPQKLARYTIIGWDGEEYIFADDREELSKLLKKNKFPLLKELEPFYNGFVGCISFDMAYREKEHRLNECGRKKDIFQFPGAILLRPRNVIILDRQEKQCKVIVNSPGLNREVEEIIKQLKQIQAVALSKDKQNPTIQPAKALYAKADFLNMVEKAKDYISAGDIFQVVLSQPFYGLTTRQPLDVYRDLRNFNPSPYHYYLQMGDYQIIGSSPEMLVRVKDGWIETRPIAGTRPRGRTDVEDSKIAAELLGDEKERAEHLMLVDLGRNDIGKVARSGTVRLKDFYKIEKYSHVMHLVSSVHGELGDEYDSVDAFWSCFPAGTVSGAPKVRALEIINELEADGRGLYAGAIGYFSSAGDIDTCIAIRTIVMQKNQAQVRVGAGIVADSDPEREYWETIHKGNAMFKALGWEVKIE
ncbi:MULTISPECIES: anthranilate synthase component I family protein [Carboxydocella]|uniref:Anthranilate synthase component 1 n=2 Tax=Carboxydocella TaxID=178898 RepID=A0A1T4RU57_9FIRM|nr:MULTISPECIES: anthranilate synthase component I family protein [Carboxydocella]AVX20388.1 anthranilate synthase component 1 [Carboxydocella thermautotrophica]AVX30811.1 anthranilate synthase component 1 [Carboxydocella thermautotrophica]SKA19406.1 anthranilate synthase component 1 [Carboxydocella sporoproducens DSM 16521]GAW28100.1 hypothetical protein ULO1_06700 [Carboxydocella sp. ULO1]GAW32477.1 hypothetical protein JDF658_22420 [Carboxydocella sp. JDF658]